jgi:hypothetical protein
VLASCDAVVDDMERRMLREVPAGERDRLRSQLMDCVRALGAGLPTP